MDLTVGIIGEAGDGIIGIGDAGQIVVAVKSETGFLFFRVGDGDKVVVRIIFIFGGAKNVGGRGQVAAVIIGKGLFIFISVDDAGAVVVLIIAVDGFGPLRIGYTDAAEVIVVTIAGDIVLWSGNGCLGITVCILPAVC